MKSLHPRVALVTGAGRGIGRATVRVRFARGARIVINDLDRIGAAEALACELGEGRALAVKADVKDPAQIDTLVAEAAAVFGKIDILVNNVGSSLGTPRFP